METFRTIKLSRGKVALVDREDFDWLSQWKWCFNSRYAVRHEQKEEYGDNPRKMVKMHRAIMRVSDDTYIDHINGNGLDNRRVNLRVATNSQNQANSSLCSKNKSGYRGVWKYNLNKPYVIKKPWGARIQVKGKKYFRGMFETKEEAAIAYNEMARNYFGEYARLNKIW